MISLIKAATLSQSNQARKQAQQTIFNARESNTQQFFIEVTRIFSSDEVDVKTRQWAGILLSSSIEYKTSSGYLWDKLTQGAKESIKDQILDVLINIDRAVRRAAANIVAAICCIEIPRNQWPNIIINLSQSIKNERIQIKQVSILTLGFICQKLKSRSDYLLEPNSQQIILSGILVGIKDNSNQIKQTALKALRDCISSMQSILANQQYRDYVVKSIAQIISDNISINYGLQILNQFGKYNYKYLTNYINGFYILLQPIMINSQKSDNCVLAMQFWQTISTQYRAQNQQNNTKLLKGQILQKITNILLQNICIVENKDQDGQNPIRQSAIKTLQSICQSNAQQIQNIIIKFTTQAINHSDWKIRQASIQAFSILLQGLNSQKSIQLVFASLLQFLKLLNDSSNFVQYSAIQSLALITQVAGIAFLKHPNFINILQLILSKIKKSQNYLKQACTIINNLTKQAKRQKLLIFTSIADDLISLLITSAISQDSSLQCLNDAMISIMNLIDVSLSKDLCLKYINFVLSNFHSLNQLTAQKKASVQTGFFTIVQTCLIAMKNHPIESKILEAIYNLVIEYFRVKRDVASDGIYVVGALTIFLPDPILVESFWPYIEHALSKYQDHQLFKATISAISDFIQRYGQNLIGKLSFVQKLIVLLRDPQFDRQLKLDILICFGEIFLSCHQLAIPYLNNLMDVLLLYFDGAIQMTTVDFQFSQLVKGTLIETLMCIVHGLNQQGKPCMELAGYLENICHFIKLSVNKTHRPTLQYIKKCMLLIADLRGFYGKIVDQYTKQQYVFESIDNLKKFNKNNQYSKEIQYILSKL